jgi:mRNA-degrading endonuclease toxin of MazEF toxin-antitoxin module
MYCAAYREEKCGRPSVVFVNQLITIHKNLLQDHIGSLPAPKLAELNVKLALALDLVTP